MPDTTDRLALPFIDAGQAQKDVTHNEALLLLDLLIQPSVEATGRDDPPADPVAGQCWIVGASPSGAWAGRPDALTIWTAAGWRFVSPREGMRVWSAADGLEATFVANRWHLGTVAARAIVVDGERVVGPQQPAIADPAGGTMIDVEARVTLVAILGALRAHGLIDG